MTWQSRIRVIVACVAAVAELLLLGRGGQNGSGSPSLFTVNAMPVVLLAGTMYVAITTLVAARVRRAERVSSWLVSGTVLSDVAFIFVLTVAVSGPQYYHRVLIFAFFALHLTTFYFGRRHAALVVVLTVLGYLLLLRHAAAAGAAIGWREESWSLGAFVLAATVVLFEHGQLRARLANLVHLFRRAEEGDFSEAYDDAADARPDAITRVGRAYNRVRGQLASMVLTDALTGCVNRRGFDQALAREIARSTRSGTDLALLALDIDHFKAINDTHGHLVGDAVLREVGALLHHAARAGDVVARVGGEEFALILPDTPAGGAYVVATRICQSLRAHAFGEDVVSRLTVSVGVAAVDASVWRSDQSAEKLKGRADEALYAAKRGGRDRVRVWAQRDEQVELGILV